MDKLSFPMPIQLITMENKDNLINTEYDVINMSTAFC